MDLFLRLIYTQYERGENMKKLDDFLSMVFASTLTIVLVTFATGISIIMAVLSIPGEQLKVVLQSVAQISLTVSIGLGAVTISLNREIKTLKLLKEIILIMIISILSYFITFWGDSLLMRMYLMLSSLLVIMILVSVARYIQDQINTQSQEENIMEEKSHIKTKKKNKNL